MRLCMFVLLSALLLPLPLVADTWTYTYTGNDFQAGLTVLPYTTSDFTSVSFTLAAPLADNYGNPVTGLAPRITPLAWSFSDGVQTDTSADAGAFSDFLLVTNGSGQIVDWDVWEEFGPSYVNDISTIDNFPLYGSETWDDGTMDDGSIAGEEEFDPGSWTLNENASPVPEGPSFAYLLLGLACFGGIALFNTRRRTQAAVRL